MPRKRKADKAIKEEIKMELTPMIDVTFLILIFFLCTLKFKTLEGKLLSYLPQDQGLTSKPDPIPKEDAEIRIRVPRTEWKKNEPLERTVQFMKGSTNHEFGRSTGVVIGSDGRVSGFKLNPPDTMDRILEFLKRVKKEVPDTKAKINAWPQAPHVYVVQIQNLMMQAGFREINFSGIPKTLVEDLQSGKLH